MHIQDVSVDRLPIRLEQFLKLAQAVESGGQAKHLIQGGQVMVNGVTETRRGRQLQMGDTVSIDQGEQYRLVSAR